jgi:molecular chaperone GrpE (heat shock protein)
MNSIDEEEIENIKRDIEEDEEEFDDASKVNVEEGVDEFNETLNDSDEFINYKEKYSKLLEQYQNMKAHQKNELDLIIKDKKDIEDRFESVMSKVAKWENDKNILLRNLELQFENRNTEIIKQILDVLDMLEDLIKLNTIEEKTKEVIIHQMNVLKNKFELTEIELKEFNPSLHIALDKKDKGSNIINCVQKGYYYKGKIIRYASVLLD